jgi:hypothetical protein
MRDEKRHIPADFSTLNHERLQIAQYTKNTMDTFPLCEPAAFFMRIEPPPGVAMRQGRVGHTEINVGVELFDFEMRKRAPTSPCRS